MDLGLPARFIIAFVVVLALIMLTAWLIRRFSGGRALHGAWSRGRDQRIEVLDAAPVDAKRRLVLVRRDHVEHLVMIGGANDFVVEDGIAPPPDVAAARAAAHREALEKAASKKKPEEREEPAPQPAAARPAPAPQPQPRPAPVQAPAQSPVKASTPEPARPAAQATPSTQAAAPMQTARPAAAQATTTTPATAEPAKPSREDAGFDDMAKRLEAALKPLDASRPTPAAKPASPSSSTPKDS